MTVPIYLEQFSAIGKVGTYKVSYVTLILCML